MTFSEYQKLALRTARDTKQKNEFFHLVLGLVGETGEIAEKIKKWVRDNGSNFDALDADDLKKELGDVLWYTAVLASFLKIDFEEVASNNIEKLASRQQRGKLRGSGDNR